MARYQARLAGAAALPGSGLSAAEAQAEADQAMTMLLRAVSAGYRDLRDLRRNKHFNPIRPRPDFQMLLMDLAFPTQPFAS